MSKEDLHDLMHKNKKFREDILGCLFDNAFDGDDDALELLERYAEALIETEGVDYYADTDYTFTDDQWLRYLSIAMYDAQYLVKHHRHDDAKLVLENAQTRFKDRNAISAYISLRWFASFPHTGDMAKPLFEELIDPFEMID